MQQQRLIHSMFSCPGHPEVHGLNRLKPAYPGCERPFSNPCLSCRYRHPRRDKAMTPQVMEEQLEWDSEVKYWKLKKLYFSHIQDVPEAVSVRVKSQTMPGIHCRAHASLRHGSLFRRNHFSNKVILLRTIVCTQYPQNGWELYYHWQFQ